MISINTNAVKDTAHAAALNLVLVVKRTVHGYACAVRFVVNFLVSNSRSNCFSSLNLPNFLFIFPKVFLLSGYGNVVLSNLRNGKIQFNA